MVDTPRSEATRPIDTAWRPSVAATRTAAATMRSRLRAGLGPLLGRVRTPQAASMLAGRPVASRSSIVSASGGVTSILRLCISYTVECITYTEGAGCPASWLAVVTGLATSGVTVFLTTAPGRGGPAGRPHRRPGRRPDRRRGQPGTA